MAGYLIDTSVIIPVLNGEPRASARFDQTTDLHLSFTVLGELFFGAFHSRRVAENVLRLEALAASIDVFTVDANTARWYGRVQADLVTKGRPIPQNDIWIAATALQYDVTLITRDAHFNEIDGLKIEAW